MGHLGVKGTDVQLIRKKLMSAYDLLAIKNLVEVAVPTVYPHVPWLSLGGEAGVAADVVRLSEQRGVLDHLLAAVAADRPFRSDLRALAIHFSRHPKWDAPLETHGMDLVDSLEALTSAGKPFLDTSRLADWLVRAERQVCQVRCGSEHGTGFLVGKDLLLTCYHVVQGHIQGAVKADEVRVRFDYRRDPDGKEPAYDAGTWHGIDANWEIPSSPFSQADVDLQGDPKTNELDYALLKLDEKLGEETPPGEERARGWVDLSSDEPLPAADDPILIVQHPRRDSMPPPQQPLKIAFATPGFEESNGNGTRIMYKPSTRKGSSGSPVFGPELRAVALHHNRGQINPNALNLKLNNRGIPLARIRADLAEEVRGALVEPP